MQLFRALLLASTIVSCSTSMSLADERDGVVTSIRPVHSLVSAVMKGVGEPYLIIKGSGSPHAYSLKPSDAEALEHAAVMFWIGEDLEAFLEAAVKNLASKAKVGTLSKAHDMVKLKFREGGPFEAHDDDHGHDDKHDHKEHAKDDDHGHDDKHDHKEHAKDDDHGHDDKHDHKEHAKHDDHGHDDKHDHKEHAKHDDHGHDDKHDHKEHAKDDDHGHDKHDHGDHAHGEVDMHLWLDPLNAKAMVHEIVEMLAEADPANAATYKKNGEALEAKLEALVGEISQTVAPVKDRPFIVFHDAYQYFEKRFGLKAAGSITVSPEKLPGAKRLKEIRAKVEELGATCVFAEPQFRPKLVKVVTDGTKAKSGTLDPLGSTVEAGPDLYFDMMRNMAKSIKDCLSPSS